MDVTVKEHEIPQVSRAGSEHRWPRIIGIRSSLHLLAHLYSTVRIY